MGAGGEGGIPNCERAREIGEKSIHNIVELDLKFVKIIDVQSEESKMTKTKFMVLKENRLNNTT